MEKNYLQDSFKEFCQKSKFEINDRQIKIVKALEIFLSPSTNFFNFLLKNKKKLCFYLFGNVGVGKTMIINHVYNHLNIRKLRLHFN